MKTTLQKPLLKGLAWLLHHANRNGCNEHFYEVKSRILTKYARRIGFKIQYIPGKKCFRCNGTGWYPKWDHYTGWYSEICWHCHKGWYKRPVWNILAEYQFGRYAFLKPVERVYKKPENTNLIFEGYIYHQRSKYSRFALFVLFCLYNRQKARLIIKTQFKRRRSRQNFFRRLKSKYQLWKLHRELNRYPEHENLPF